MLKRQKKQDKKEQQEKILDRIPVVPTRLADLGINTTLLREILLKTMLRRNLDNVISLADSMRVGVPIMQELLEITREYNQIETLGASRHEEPKNLRYILTSTGRQTALDALSQSEYFGAVPVPLEDYKIQTSKQSVRDAIVTRENLGTAMAHLIITDKMFNQLGPAVNSPRSVLMYGPPGNGKSSIADGIRNAYVDHIYVPEFIEYAGNVISLFDPLIHERINEEPQDTVSLRLKSDSHDPRYIKCHRPTVITGGELTLDMLDLNYNPVSKTYQAPLQMKASGGVFIVDDLGRQKEPPQTLINRWIVPMEEGFDILTLQSGQKFIVPFDTKVMFSTNFAPASIFDTAALRRIYYKIYIGNPSQSDFLKIFVKVAERYPMDLDDDVLAHLL
ncbi:MAG: ATPase, partial [Rhodobacteraceae bacterium]|nr:ATPase [Paracoccaceae bacterium]